MCVRRWLFPGERKGTTVTTRPLNTDAAVNGQLPFTDQSFGCKRHKSQWSDSTRFSLYISKSHGASRRKRVYGFTRLVHSWLARTSELSFSHLRSSTLFSILTLFLSLILTNTTIYSILYMLCVLPALRASLFTLRSSCNFVILQRTLRLTRLHTNRIGNQ